METEQIAVTETNAETLAVVTQLQAKVNALQVQLDAKDSIVKVPVDDETFGKAIASLEAINADSLVSGNPPARPAFSLTKILGVTPAKTKEQNVVWKLFKSKWDKAFSKAHRELVPQRKAILARVMRNGAASISTVAKSRKDQTVSRVSISASEPAKSRKGKGLKKAKPAQVAAHVPAAGNAVEPAIVS
jgi:hypothetical protein